MKRLLLVLTLTACQPILGIEERELDPVRGGCELSNAGDALVRFANLAPNSALAVDLCLSSAGRGLLRGGGTACPAGFSYAQVSRLFQVANGTYDLKVVPYGSRCDAPALAELRGLAIAPGKTTTLAYLGPALLGAYVDEAKLTTGKTLVRLVNAIPDGPALDVGLTGDNRPPTKMLQRLFASPVRYGQSSAGSAAVTFPVTPDGYCAVPSAGTNLGAGPEGTGTASLATGLPGEDAVRTLYAIGDPKQPLLPPRGLLCDDRARDVTPLASCTLTMLATLSVEVISAGLFGGVAKVENERREPLLQRIAQRDADFVCVTQLGRRADKARLISLAKPRFPHVVNVDTNLDTKPTAPEDAPPDPTVPSCGGAGDPIKTKAVLDCLSTKCTDTGNDDGKLRSSGLWTKPNADCLSERCVAEFIALLDGATAAQRLAQARCYNCAIANFLSDKTMAEVRGTCTTDVRDPYSFDGETPSLLLSRFALREQASFILPATVYRRAVHFARAEIEPGKEVDVYCGHVNANFGDVVPYSGHHSSKSGSEAWLEERALEVKRLADWITVKSGGRSVILAGEWDSSNAIKDSKGNIVIEARDPDVVDALETAFARAIPAGRDPECTMCPENRVGNAVLRLLPTRVYTLRFPAAAATDLSVFFKEPIVPMPGAEFAPLSGIYGLNVRVKRP